MPFSLYDPQTLQAVALALEVHCQNFNLSCLWPLVSQVKSPFKSIYIEMTLSSDSLNKIMLVSKEVVDALLSNCKLRFIIVSTLSFILASI